MIFMDESVSAPDPAEAEQWGAVQALVHVAGDRQLHLLLPPQYRELWHSLKASSEKRTAQQAARAVAVDERKQREKEQRARMALRGPKVRNGGIRQRWLRL